MLTLGARPLHAQFVVRSGLSWRTVETEHFAFHYPRELEAWTLAIASRIEAIDSAVSHVVGYTPPDKTQIVVDDPFETPNGSAWPYLNQPLIMLWASTPTPRDDIGEFRTWGDMLVSHEFAHIAHLSRPSRNGGTRRLWEALPVDLGPIPLRTPRWAIEGYATYVEGRVSGSGRPFGTWRAAFLRQWALEGQLPRYEQLNAWGAYAGGEFAYLAGSAFLEWLVERRGDSSLVDVWRRLSAKQNRTFDEAFTGVFGESPAALYGKFSVDVIAKATDAARTVRAAGADTGSIEQRLARGTGDPAISADGQRVAIVVRSATLPSRVVIWRTAAEPDTGRARRDSLLRAADPEDVPARPIYPPAKRPVATLRSSGASYESPRFLRDGRLLLWKSTPRGDGSYVSDLYLWDPRTRSVHRVTHDASLTDADPAPDGLSAYATRCRHGWCDLVSVDLRSGDVSTLAEGSPRRSFYRPRVRPGVSRDAIVSMHDGSSWRLALFDAAAKSIRALELGSGANRYDAAWISATQLVDVSEAGGIANLETFDITDLRPTRLTSVTGAAVAPEPQPRSNAVWFLSLYSRGYDLRRVDAAVSRPARVALSPALAPAAPPASTLTPPFPTNAVSSPRPFGLAPRLFRWFPQPSADADGASAGVTLSSRDVIGRSEITGTFLWGDAAAWRGGNVSATWRGFLPALRLQGFAVGQRLSDSRSPIAGALSVADPASRRLDTRLAGGVMSLDGTYSLEKWSARYRLGVSGSQLREQIVGTVASTGARTIAFGDAGVGFVQRGDAVSFSESVSSNVTTGRTIGSSFTRGTLSASLGASGSRIAFPISAAATYGRMTTNAPLFEQFALGGGPPVVFDRLLISQRWSMPVLPAETAVGGSALAYRVNVSVSPLVWYWWAGATTPPGDPFTEWHRVAGVEWSEAVSAIVPAGTPAARGVIGLGESLDPPLRRKLRAYVSLVINP